MVAAATAVAAAAAILLAPGVRRLLHPPEETQAFARAGGPAVATPLVHRASALVVEEGRDRGDRLARFEIESAVGGIAFTGPQELRVRVGDEYSLSVDGDRRPVAFTNHALGVTWGLPVTAPSAPPGWLPAAILTLLGLIVVSVLLAGATALSDAFVESVLDALRSWFDDVDWLAASHDSAVRDLERWLGGAALGLALVALSGVVGVRAGTRARVRPVTPMAVRAVGLADDWAPVPPEAQPLTSRRK